MPRVKNNANLSDKANDFKGSILRLIKELKPFKVLVIIALILASFSAVLSILAPDKLSNLTDEISKGLVLREDKLSLVTETITKNLKSEKMAEILNFDLSKSNIASLYQRGNITKNEIDELETVLIKLETVEDQEEVIKLMSSLSDNILEVLLPDMDDVTSKDRVAFLKSIQSKDQKIPDTVAAIILPDINIDGKIITSDEQYEFLTIMGGINKDSNVNDIYQSIDRLPLNIYNLVKPKMDMDAIKSIGLFLITIYLCSALFNYIQTISMATVSNNFAKNLRNRISVKINKLPLKYFDSHQTGDVLSRVTNDVDLISQTMNQSLASLVSSTILFLGTIFMMFYTNWVMAVTAIVSSLIGFCGVAVILKSSQKYFIARQQELGNLNGHIEEVYSGLNVVKAYNGKKKADEVFNKYNNLVCVCNRKSQFLSGLMNPMMSFIGNFSYVAVCIVGALLTMNNHITFGVIVAFITYVRLFTGPLTQIAQALTSLQSTAAAGERVFEFLDESEMSDQLEIKKTLDVASVKGNIEFKNVVFKYPSSESPVIKNFTASAHVGEKIAIVGPTGAGKTTMVNLLMKFYEIDEGDILIDGESIHDLTRENVHELFTMVLQDTWLFNGTIKENIIYNRDNVSDEEVVDVCKTIGLDHFIKTLPNTYDSVITENDSISAGQKQLLTIARAMIDKSPFLILDEATSNVDTRTEELVQTAMDKLTEGKTSFIIAHRLSTIKNADLILVMKDGNIIEQGNHDELIKQNGFYAGLYNSQFEL